MTEEKNIMLQDLRAIADYQKRVSGDRNSDHILYAMASVMSEDNLHEVIAAITEMIDYPMGYNFWYGERSNFIDRDFWR